MTSRNAVIVGTGKGKSVSEHVAQKQALTPKQAEFLGNFRALLERHGLPPSLDDLGRITGVSKSATQSFVRSLIRKGYLRKSDRRYRSLELVK